MQCAACGAVNDEGRSYCGHCAHSLGRHCQVCEFFNGEGVRYCGGCARDLVAPRSGPAPVRTAVPAPSPAAVQPHATCAPAAVFDNLDDLHCAPGPAPDRETLPAPATDTTNQEQIDGFFQRLVREGVAEINTTSAARQPPGPRRNAPS